MTADLEGLNLEHCRGCDAHHIMPDGGEAYFCTKLAAIALRHPVTNGWVMFIGPAVIPLLGCFSSVTKFMKGFVS